MNFNEAPEFQKDVKRLTKKWRSIPNDIEAAKKYIEPLYIIKADDVEVVEYRRDFFNGKNAAILKENDSTEVIKMRLDVADLGRNDKVRIVFVTMKNDDGITFIELFAKNDKDREDEKRIKKYF